MARQEVPFAICLRNEGYAGSLEVRKLYRPAAAGRRPGEHPTPNALEAHMATWNRRVTVTGDNQYLQVDNLTSNPNPPGANDPPNSITTDAGERPAIINYLAVGYGPQLSDVVMKDGSSVPGWLTYSRNGPNLQVTDNGGPGTTASYYVRGTYNNAALQTQDPQIHNE